MTHWTNRNLPERHGRKDGEANSMTKKLRANAALLVIASLALLLYAARPKPLPPDGTVRHIWQVTWLTQSNTILVTEHPFTGKVTQQFFSDTANPRRNWGEENIHYHWFGLPPTFEVPPDNDGNRCSGKMVK